MDFNSHIPHLSNIVFDKQIIILINYIIYIQYIFYIEILGNLSDCQSHIGMSGKVLHKVQSYYSLVTFLNKKQQFLSSVFKLSPIIKYLLYLLQKIIFLYNFVHTNYRKK